MRWLLVAGGLAAGLALALAVLAVLGSRLPREHEASRRTTLRRPPAEVFAVLQDVARAPEWRGDVKHVTLLGEVDGRQRFREEGAHGAITFEVVESVPATRLVTRIADPALPFGGTWTYELAPVAGGTELAITERGFVNPPLFRALSRYVFGHHRTLEQYLRALAKRLGGAG